MFSVDPDHVLVEEDLLTNKVFVGILYFSEIDRTSEAC